jgi:Glycosyl hydrolases family 25
MATLLGIDISHWQERTPKLAARSFVFVRATYGDGIDGRYTAHAAKVRAAGRVLGAYHFGRNVRPVAAQVQAFLAKAANADLLALDVEKDGHNDRPDDPAMTHKQAREFVTAVHAAGRRIGLYHSESNFFDAGQDWDWVANWDREPRRRYDIWQYRGSPLDLDRFRGTRAQLLALGDLPPAPDTDVDTLEGPMNLTKAHYRRGVRVAAGHGIFRIASQDGAFLIRNTKADEVLPLVGNTGTGWQIVDPGEAGGEAGFVNNQFVLAFVDLELPLAALTVPAGAAAAPIHAELKAAGDSLTTAQTRIANAVTKLSGNP